MINREVEAIRKGKSQVQHNYERDPAYCPYCLRCPGLQRMRLVEPYYWRCPKCPAVGDFRGEREKHLHYQLNDRLEEAVRKYFEGDSSGHDWDHTDRVRRLAMTIASQQSAEVDFVEAAALLHDAGDWKLSGPHGCETADPVETQRRVVTEILNGTQLATPGQIVRIVGIVCSISFKGAGVPDQPLDLETQCVMDADRLDAMGAIGIARCFAYGGSRGRPIYRAGEKPEKHETFAEYRNNDSSSFGHFFEKLLLLKDRMQTGCGQILAESRHEFLVQFVRQMQHELNWIDVTSCGDVELLTPSTAPSDKCVNCGTPRAIDTVHPNLCDSCYQASQPPKG